MSVCHVQASGNIELFFYGELAGAERSALERHLVECAECRRALEELTLIRMALDARPDVSAPPGGDWSGFMSRLGDAVRAEGTTAQIGATARVVPFRQRRRLIAVAAMAALIALVTITALVVMREEAPGPSGPAAAAVVSKPSEPDAALTQLSEQHFERSKLVVLGLATKDASDAAGVDWDYERTLATSLLSDTRLYRQAAEERGMKTLADVMRDLELVLLQTSMAETPDAESLGQLQRLIRRRDLITKMEVLTTTGLVP
jgi:putative zinc finger protein